MAGTTGTAVTSEIVAQGLQAGDSDALNKELANICEQLQKCIEIREKYMQISLQEPGNNPKDSDDWDIYPVKKRFLMGLASTFTKLQFFLFFSS